MLQLSELHQPETKARLLQGQRARDEPMRSELIDKEVGKVTMLDAPFGKIEPIH